MILDIMSGASSRYQQGYDDGRQDERRKQRERREKRRKRRREWRNQGCLIWFAIPIGTALLVIV